MLIFWGVVQLPFNLPMVRKVPVRVCQKKMYHGVVPQYQCMFNNKTLKSGYSIHMAQILVENIVCNYILYSICQKKKAY